MDANHCLRCNVRELFGYNLRVVPREAISNEKGKKSDTRHDTDIDCILLGTWHPADHWESEKLICSLRLTFLRSSAVFEKRNK